MNERVDYPEVWRGPRPNAAFSKVAHGLYAARSPRRDLARELRAWALVLPSGSCFTHLTSAELRGWWLPPSIRHPVFAATREGVTCPQRSGLLITRHPEWPPREVVAGVPVASGAETLLAAARDLHVLDLVLMGDSALRLGHTTLADLTAASRQRRRGAPMLRRVIPPLDKRSESAWESIMRVLHQAAEIEVEPQYEVFNDRGRLVARADFLIVGTKRLHEYDGDEHREKDAFRYGLKRERRLADEGFQRVGFVSNHLIDEGAEVIQSADLALCRPWDRRRLDRWNALVDASLIGAAGRVRALDRWGFAGPPRLSTVEGSGGPVTPQLSTVSRVERRPQLRWER